MTGFCILYLQAFSSGKDLCYGIRGLDLWVVFFFCWFINLTKDFYKNKHIKYRLFH